MRTILVAAGLAITTAVMIPSIGQSAEDAAAPQLGHATPITEHGDGDRGGPGSWMHGEGGAGMHGMMRHRSPRERCQERLAWRAAMRAYTEAKLDLTPEQRPLWDRVQNIAHTEAQKERQLCSSEQPRGEATVLERLDRTQQFLSTRLEALQAARPAVQALYQALSPEQRAIFDHPYRH